MGKTAGVFFKDNWSYIDENLHRMKEEVGKTFLTVNGTNETREGVYEKGSEVWSRELVSFAAYDLVGIIDADFEIFDPDFLNECFLAFNNDKQLGFWSVSFSSQRYYYETYSGEYCYLHQRYNTWFCVYRRSALDLECNFGYYEERCGDEVHKWDHSAKLQDELASKYGFTGLSLGEQHNWKFLHYGAFAKNRSLCGKKLYWYRILRIGKHNGFRHIHRSRYLGLAFRPIFYIAFRILGFRKFDRERQHYLFQPLS